MITSPPTQSSLVGLSSSPGILFCFPFAQETVELLPSVHEVEGAFLPLLKYLTPHLSIRADARHIWQPVYNPSTWDVSSGEPWGSNRDPALT